MMRFAFSTVKASRPTSSQAFSRGIWGDDNGVLDDHAHHQGKELDTQGHSEEAFTKFSIDAAVLRLHNRDPAASLREIAEQAKLSVSTIHYILTTRIGYKYRKCWFVPHSLSAKQKEDRLTQSRELFQVLQNTKRLRWRFILTNDESWFFYMNEHQKLWLRPDAKASEVTRRLINTSKVMITLFWNTFGLQISNFLEGESFNAEYFVRNILNPVHSLPIVGVAHKQRKRFIFHMDNSPIHKGKVTRAKLSQMTVYLAPHPPYSPDLAPLEFFLFGYLKRKMQGLEFDSPEALLA
jgi:hypothetical protein